MSHHKLRIDKTCLNCNTIVEDRFCSHCGQENTETRQSFHYLILHFIEDFVHYDNSFWSTIKNLFIRPGKITNEYLSGKRQKSVNPVKLYIFISFVTFFIIAVFPSKHIENQNKNSLKFEVHREGTYKQENKKDEINLYNEDDYISGTLEKRYNELEKRGLSHQEIEKLIAHKILSLTPKVLFVYMPFFTLLLWLFYNKKKYWYFDHGIFTLHYFSVVLLSVLVIFILNKISDYANIPFVTTCIDWICYFIGIYIFFNFIAALYNRYRESFFKTGFKAFFLLAINFVFFVTIVVSLIIYSVVYIE